MGELFQLLGKLSPTVLVVVLALSVIGGLGYIILLLVRQDQASVRNMALLQENHLHELPDIAETLRRMEHQQQAVAAALLGQLADIRESLAWLKARIERRNL